MQRVLATHAGSKWGAWSCAIHVGSDLYERDARDVYEYANMWCRNIHICDVIREVYFKTLYIATIGMTSIGQPLVGCVQYIRSNK